MISTPTADSMTALRKFFLGACLLRILKKHRYKRRLDGLLHEIAQFSEIFRFEAYDSEFAINTKRRPPDERLVADPYFRPGIVKPCWVAKCVPRCLRLVYRPCERCEQGTSEEIRKSIRNLGRSFLMFMLLCAGDSAFRFVPGNQDDHAMITEVGALSPCSATSG